jgi:hypothetical protein
LLCTAPEHPAHAASPQIAMGVADEKMKPWLPARLHPGLLAAATACCDYDPQLRPSAATVVSELHAALDELRQQVRVRVPWCGAWGAWGAGRCPLRTAGALLPAWEGRACALYAGKG